MNRKASVLWQNSNSIATFFLQTLSINHTQIVSGTINGIVNKNSQDMIGGNNKHIMAPDVRKEIDFISDINDRYALVEYELEEKLKSLDQNVQDLLNAEATETLNPCEKIRPSLTLEAARQRNFELLKSLEVSKARMRSRATFSPLETILQKAIGNYLKETSLIPCTTRKAYGPTYV